MADLNNGMSRNKASKKYSIPKSTIHSRLTSNWVPGTTVGTRPTLSEEEEASIAQ